MKTGFHFLLLALGVETQHRYLCTLGSFIIVYFSFVFVSLLLKAGEIRAALSLFIIVYHGVGSECFYVITISHSPAAKYKMNPQLF